MLKRQVSQMLRAALQILLLFSVTGSLLTYAESNGPRDPSKHFYEQSLGTLTDDLEDAKSSGKKGILIFFQQKDCPFCHRMKNTVLNQREVQDYYRERFLILDMDIESNADYTDFNDNPTTPKKFFSVVTRNRNATPVFAFFDLEGKLVVRYTGATSGVEEFMWLGEYASEGIYKKQSFTRYKRERRKARQGS
jgi:thioredoxin-related protein